ncbi:uncharacterized protein PITG_14095 [Phytophthora infestans T30-4]|uniref:Uncharacterized protein n=1 Tax=Phytophthora infestans (strain T30-4) TaxID=403677 RepID=D0NNM1_PHYIT|nr:uncharacterized protein PITG_14095 [Phytophthora infestans T30-4]EEY62192.1 conserved hypothetical protein [Phytophthora infestans T30-4]|eukprot:XP_002899223.1 conserved hypothetical protein [Phytophthora infestans T30-4]
MDGEGEVQEQPKRVAPLSTVSLDSTYDHDDEKQPLRNRFSWAPFIVLVGLVLVAVGLVLALDRDDTGQHGVAVAEEDPIFSTTHSSLTSDKGLTAPQKKLGGWLKQTRNASDLYVEGGSSNVSLTGVLFPLNESETSLPFDGLVSIDSGLVLSSRQYVALANGRGYKWVETSLGLGDSIVTSGSKWVSDEDKGEVSVVFNGEKYTISKNEDFDYYSSDMEDCWLIESESDDFALRACTPTFGNVLLRSDFAELFSATKGCPQLAPKTTRLTRHNLLSVPLPLRKWYASYKE